MIFGSYGRVVYTCKDYHRMIVDEAISEIFDPLIKFLSILDVDPVTLWTLCIICCRMFSLCVFV